MSDAEVFEAQLVENLIRAEIHPMEEAEGFARLLALEEAEVQRRANRGEGWQATFVCGFKVEIG